MHLLNKSFVLVLFEAELLEHVQCLAGRFESSFVVLGVRGQGAEPKVVKSQRLFPLEVSGHFYEFRTLGLSQ
jgi:hypothetical protein